MTTAELDLYEIAFLAGGVDRVIDTALVALVESGRIRVHAPGELAVVEPGRSHPVEGAVMDAVGTHGHRSVDTIRWRLADDARLSEPGTSLAASGLLRRRSRLRRRRSSGSAWSPTSTGRETLRRLADDPGAARVLDGGHAFQVAALQVALRGREALPDPRSRSEIFERPLPPLPRSSGMDRRIRDAGLHDPGHAAFRTQHGAIGGAAAIGFLEGGGGDGGGF
ncbi:TIGR04222 domain-containing membrane protein [Blastococcus haudaquaticus]|uniref:TIGR04222 domain-containing protein n=1 Tax=Blastococcus haudaquaticus TaxID=1938745 RepID=A0A286GFW1_9ACTN|nr:TIGR04222 domain-containing membrane protein [Blastococcus haudaquaticus]SOD94019.1 TIGR04222 domain-containing protein [Blastococcus haudaquaticus]